MSECDVVVARAEAADPASRSATRFPFSNICMPRTPSPEESADDLAWGEAQPAGYNVLVDKIEAQVPAYPEPKNRKMLND